MLVQTPQRVVEQSHQFVGGTMQRLILALGMFRHRNWLTPLQPRLEHATLIMFAVLAAVLVAQVYLDP